MYVLYTSRPDKINLNEHPKVNATKISESSFQLYKAKIRTSIIYHTINKNFKMIR